MAATNGHAPGRRRVVITGIGAITPLGEDVETFWQALVAGRSGVGYMTLADTTNYPTKLAAEVKDWQPERHIERREARRMARFSQFAVAAAGQAIADAGLDLDREDRTRIGVYLGNGNGGYPNIDEAVRTIMAKGGMRLDPLFMPKSLPNMAAAQVSLQYGLKGYTGTTITACAAATQAVGEAAEVIRRGAADVILSGGTEAGISELGLAAFSVMRAMSTRSDDPARASRPFDKDRDGFIPAEGSGIFVLESLEHALARGARIYGEVAGYAASSDAYHIVAPCADGEGAARTIAWALADAGRLPHEIDYINAHGTSTPMNDSAETKAIKSAMGEHAYSVPISSTKSMIGHAFGASGALELIACVKSIETGTIHPTINYETPDPECDLDYVPNTARRADVHVVLKNSFGFGGQNACVVLEQFGSVGSD
ncbi:MAG TPA: beta-ketoacyl-ACP synthase II [Dehalococcoidia bacterium]|nr:beta-ketoacyl-ACP synthase II [Dehalococcoidia bacterium]